MFKPLCLKILLEDIQKILQPLSESNRLEAELLIAYVLNKPKSYLYSYSESFLSENQIDRLRNLVARRLAKEPLAYLLGEKAFWMHSFHVNRATLIPRPETECLIEQVLTQCSDRSFLSLVDLGTGCGAIALSLAAAKKNWMITAIDQSEDAVQVAQHNAHRFDLSHVRFIVSNWCQALKVNSQDIIVSNPPYISEAEWHLYEADLAYEPREALLSGPEGLDDITLIVDSARKTLKKGGYLFIEHGYQQGKEVRDLFKNFSYCGIRTVRDLAGHERVTYGQWFSIVG